MHFVICWPERTYQLPDISPYFHCSPHLLVLNCLWHKQGLAGIVGNPVLSQAIAGLATSATAQATLERVMLFDLKDTIIEPFGETAQQVFARISALRDSLDGPQVRLPHHMVLQCCDIFVHLCHAFYASPAQLSGCRAACGNVCKSTIVLHCPTGLFFVSSHLVPLTTAANLFDDFVYVAGQQCCCLFNKGSQAPWGT